VKELEDPGEGKVARLRGTVAFDLGLKVGERGCEEIESLRKGENAS